MKFAFVNGQRQESQPNLSGECPACRGPVVAKCGEVRVWHWAHKGRLHCDPWKENETPWHRAWKNEFPADWQEIVHSADDGERHIADVETAGGWVIEFQHSYIKPEERRSREAFYRKLIWVVDGRRRKTGGAQFLKALNEGLVVRSTPVRRGMPPNCSRPSSHLFGPRPSGNRWDGTAATSQVSETLPGLRPVRRFSRGPPLNPEVFDWPSCCSLTRPKTPCRLDSREGPNGHVSERVVQSESEIVEFIVVPTRPATPSNKLIECAFGYESLLVIKAPTVRPVLPGRVDDTDNNCGSNFVQLRNGF